MKLSSTLISTALSLLNISAQSTEDRRLLKLGEDQKPQWFSEAQVSKLIENDAHFIDVTDDKPSSRSALPVIQDNFEVPTDTKYWDVAEAAIQQLSQDRARKFITKLSSYYNRYFNTTDGADAAEWIHSQASEVALKYGKGASVSFFNHTWIQPSVIARIEGSEYPDQIVLLGSHLDSINKASRWSGRAPGADDDGTGSATLIETLRALTKIGFKPKRTIEFRWYAAEEVGVRGSRVVAQQYRSQGKNVITQLQSDMNGHSLNKQVRIINDFTDPQLNTFIKRLVESYTEYWWIDGKCGYACSDHAAWNEQGYRSAFAFEDVAQPLLHTEQDTVENVDFKNWLEYTKIVTGYLVEIAEPSN